MSGHFHLWYSGTLSKMIYTMIKNRKIFVDKPLTQSYTIPFSTLQNQKRAKKPRIYWDLGSFGFIGMLYVDPTSKIFLLCD